MLTHQLSKNFTRSNISKRNENYISLSLIHVVAVVAVVVVAVVVVVPQNLSSKIKADYLSFEQNYFKGFFRHPSEKTIKRNTRERNRRRVIMGVRDRDSVTRWRDYLGR